LFSVSGGHGHFHPLVPLARALKEAGHEVAFATGPSMRPLVEASGFTHLPVGGNLAADPEYQEFQAQRKTMPPGLETEMLVYSKLFCGIAPRLRTPDLVAVAESWQPDMFIREAAEYAAAIAAEHLGLPHAAIAVGASLTGFALFERAAAGQLDPIRESWGLAPDPTLASLYRYLYLAYSPPTFSLHDLSEMSLPGTAPSIPTTTHFIRPDLFDQSGSERLPDWIPHLRETGQPVVYATVGTEANNEPGVYPAVMRAIIKGLRDAPLNLIVTLGRDKDPADLGPQPLNVHIERYIPQSLLLPCCDLILMHGGSGSLLQALDAGLPMVLLPLIADQFFNADVAQDLNLGRVIQTWHPAHPGQLQLDRITPALIREAVLEVLHNPTYRHSVRQLQTEMHTLPDQTQAAHLILSLAANPVTPPTLENK
jgi:UDP:flavonoid glycosyltransferase YjiC (YdhE family)